MANHGLTRVECRGDKVVVVAGPVPQHIQEQMQSAEVEKSPMTRRIEKKINLPPRFIAPPKADVTKPQADEKKETK